MRFGRWGWVVGLAMAALLAGACGLEQKRAEPGDDGLPELSAERLGTPGSVWDTLEPEERVALERSGMSGIAEHGDGPADPDAFFEPRDSTADKAGKVGFSLLMVAATIGSAVAPFFLF